MYNLSRLVRSFAFVITVVTILQVVWQLRDGVNDRRMVPPDFTVADKRINLHSQTAHIYHSSSTRGFLDSVDTIRVKESIIKSNSCDMVSPPKESQIDYRNRYWQAFHDSRNEIIIYSAVYDDRPDSGIVPVVRMLGVSKALQGDVFCQVWYHDVNKPYITKLTSLSTGRGEYFNNTHYQQNLYTCELPGSLPLPTHVSIVTDKCKTSTILLPVFLPVRSHWQHEFGICVAISFGEIDVDQFVEWAEMHRILGVSEINIYNATISSAYDPIFDYYQRQGLVVVHQMPPPVQRYDKAGAKFSSPASLNDCMLKNMYRYHYIVVVDFDEVIIPKMQQNYTALLAYIDKVNELKEPWLSYTFRNAYFLLDFPPDHTQPKFSRILQYKTRVAYSPYMFGPKSFIDPRKCLSVFNHYCWIRYPSNPDRFTIDVEPKIAASHHYKRCNLGKNKCDQMAKTKTDDLTILSFKNVLLKQIEIARKALNLV